MRFISNIAFVFLILSIQRQVVRSADELTTAAEIYRARVIPLLESSDRSSCSQCHLRGLELNDFLSIDQAKTFSDLRTRGWIDVEHPDKSKLLDFILRGSEDPDPLLKRVRDAEYIALKSWIAAAVREPNLLNQPIKADDDLQLSIEFIRHARKDQVLARFSEAIWSQLQRCAGCHSPERNQKQVEKHGEQMTWIVPQQPDATLALLTERKLIDIQGPEQSELLTKPLGLVKHGGGPKFAIGSLTDRKWRAFLVDYAKIVREGYKPETPLPKTLTRRSWLSEMQLKITNMPAEWRGRLLTISLHPRGKGDRWSDQPIAISDGPVARKQLVWQGAMTVFQEIESHGKLSEWSQPIITQNAIPKGRYQLRVQLGRLVVSEDFQPVEETSEASPSVLVATAEIDAPWPPGHQPPMTLNFSDLKWLLQSDEHRIMLELTLSNCNQLFADIIL